MMNENDHGIFATVLADSISPYGKRLTTIRYHAHRFILAEINTHGLLAKNARSSRAVPVPTMLKEVRTNPAYPAKWQKNKRGMQGGEPMTDAEIQQAKAAWLKAANDAAYNAETLSHSCNLHKQWANRGLEPYLFVDGVITATDWNNFFALRISEEAQPEFNILATCIQQAINNSKPMLVVMGDWHLPYINTGDRIDIYDYLDDTINIRQDKEREYLFLDIAKKLSAARVARVSYKPFDGDSTIEKELERAKHLLDNKHMSPFQHQATPDRPAHFLYRKVLKVKKWKNQEKHAHFNGWISYRMTIDGEHVEG